MVPRLERGEWVGLAGLAVGFSPFTLGALSTLSAGAQPGAVALGGLGAAVGAVAAGYLVVYYHVLRVVGR